MKRGGIYSIVCFLVLLVSLTSISLAEESIFFNGNIDFRLDKNYSAGQTISSTITISNPEDFPIAEANLVIDLVKGCSEPIYPSQISDCDNIIYEEIISDLNLAPKTSKQIQFSYTLPSDLQSGIYRIDSYLVVGKAPIIGIPSILISGIYKSFYIQGTENVKEVKILRTKTNIKNQAGPIGVGVEKNEKINLEVYINSSSEESTELFVKICDWEDTTCKTSNFEKIIPLSLKTGENKVNVEFNAPTSTSAYPIRLEIRKNGKTLSLYRSRIVVFGESAKIRKLYTDKYYYNNEKAKISVLVGGSPDHYNNPVVKNVLLEVSLTNKINNKKYENSKKLSELSLDNFFVKEEFEFNVDELSEFEVCAELSNSETNEIYDEYCYIVDSAKFSSNIHLIELVENYDDNSFNGKICIKDSITKSPIKSEIFYIVKKPQDIVKQNRLEIDGCINLVFNMEKDIPYSILVQDKLTNQDFNFEVVNKSKKIDKNILLYLVAAIVAIIVIIIIFVMKRKRKNEV